MTKNCPNCGAPIQGEKCNFCGTRFTKKEILIPVDHEFIGVFEQAIKDRRPIHVGYNPRSLEYTILIQTSEHNTIRGAMGAFYSNHCSPLIAEYLREKTMYPERATEKEAETNG